jgi:hypothetical protein
MRQLGRLRRSARLQSAGRTAQQRNLLQGIAS